MMMTKNYLLHQLLDLDLICGEGYKEGVKHQGESDKELYSWFCESLLDEDQTQQGDTINIRWFINVLSDLSSDDEKANELSAIFFDEWQNHAIVSDLSDEYIREYTVVDRSSNSREKFFYGIYGRIWNKLRWGNPWHDKVHSVKARGQILEVFFDRYMNRHRRLVKQRTEVHIEVQHKYAMLLDPFWKKMVKEFVRAMPTYSELMLWIDMAYGSYEETLLSQDETEEFYDE